MATALELQIAQFPNQAPYQISNIPTDLIHHHSQPSIVDAKDFHMDPQQVKNTIKAIAKKELQDSIGLIYPASYVIPEYFQNISYRPGLATPETILLATVSDQIVGFAITAKRNPPEEKTEFPGWTLPVDTCDLSYLAVEASYQNSGIGTQLMLAMMKKTKALGKRYLTLNYISESSNPTENAQALKRKNFYHSLARKFHLSITENHDQFSSLFSTQIHTHLSYDLKDFLLLPIYEDPRS